MDDAKMKRQVEKDNGKTRWPKKKKPKTPSKTQPTKSS